MEGSTSSTVRNNIHHNEEANCSEASSIIHHNANANHSAARRYLTRHLMLAVLLVGFCLRLDAQISVKIEHRTIREALTIIEKTSDYSFFYSTSLNDLDKTVTIDFTDAGISHVLDALFKGTDIGYTIRDDRQILLSQIDRTVSNDKNNGTAAGKDLFVVRGNISDAAGLPVIGAGIMLEGSSEGTVSDMDGNWSLYLKSGNGRLTFSSLGYQTKTIDIQNRKTIDITLEEESKVLDEVVVEAYGTQKKANLAISKIPGVAMDEEKRNVYLGESHFLRALYYFDLLTFYSGHKNSDLGVPLYTEMPEYDKAFHPRSTPADVREVMISDLKKAIELLPWRPKQKGRSSRSAALMLLGKVYLYADLYTEAAETFSQLMKENEQSGEPYTLSSDYGKMFTLEGENNNEYMFVISCLDTYGNGSYTDLLYSTRSGNCSGTNTSIPTIHLANAYLNKDGSERGDTKRLQSHIILPSNYIDEVWNGNTKIAKWLSVGSLPLSEADNRTFFLKFGDIVVSIRYLLANDITGKDVKPTLFIDTDGTQVFSNGNAMRITANLSDARPAKWSRGTVAMWWRSVEASVVNSRGEISEYGFCWSLSRVPDIEDSHIALNGVSGDAQGGAFVKALYGGAQDGSYADFTKMNSFYSVASKVTGLATYRIGEHEVTYGEYVTFLNFHRSTTVKDGSYKGKKLFWDECSIFTYDSTNGTWSVPKEMENRPATGITWFGASEFCSFNGGFLPNEPQWECAARAAIYTDTLPGKTGENVSDDAGDSTGENENAGNLMYMYSGSNNLDEVAVYGQTETNPLCSKKANALGIYDMTGNAQEWTRTNWFRTYSSVWADDNPNGKTMVARGGRCQRGLFASFHNGSREGFAGETYTEGKSQYLGFRFCDASFESE